MFLSHQKGGGRSQAVWSPWTYLHLLQHSVSQRGGEVVLFTFHAL